RAAVSHVTLVRRLRGRYVVQPLGGQSQIQRGGPVARIETNRLRELFASVVIASGLVVGDAERARDGGIVGTGGARPLQARDAVGVHLPRRRAPNRERRQADSND